MYDYCCRAQVEPKASTFHGAMCTILSFDASRGAYAQRRSLIDFWLYEQ